MNVTEKIDKYLNEGKSKVNYDMGPSMSIKAVGQDNNGNYSYWLEVAGKNKNVKVQHGATETSGSKITKDDIKKDNVDKTTVDDIKSYVKKYIMKK